jgi:4-amino-4-deoxy-L-arabinose transferase-like glycosyltransferase
MSITSRLSRYSNISLRIFTELILLAGIGLRLVLFFQNRNLIIDEANIVRNLAERGYGGLALPLRYEQYAPPVFLWIEKLSSQLFGYGEKAMRLYPLLAGIAATFVMYKLAARLMTKASLWLPVGLLAIGAFFIEYSTVMKQYMPDALISLSLIWLALKWNINELRPDRFVLYWIVAGSLAIWSSMPAVFILAGIGGYYCWHSFRLYQRTRLPQLMIIGSVWVLQFAFYYITILKPQINSDYLQNYHREFFLFATPGSAAEWQHNWERIREILYHTVGITDTVIAAAIVLILIGSVNLLIRRTAHFLLIAVPCLLVLLAAALDQYSLIARVILFMMPLLMLLIGAGFDVLMQGPRELRGLTVVLGLYMLYACAGFFYVRNPLRFHEITNGLEWIENRGGRGYQLYVHDANVPTYIYYTQLHPGKAKWAPLLGAHKLTWEDDYTELTKNLKDTAYFIYTGGFAEGERKRRIAEIEKNMKQIDYFERDICFVFVYAPKSTADTASTGPGTTPN